MNCEHVEDLLSAYLDNALTTQEQMAVQEHTRTCPACRETLADYRRFDALLMDLPRVSPSAELREKIFSSPDYLELIGKTETMGTAGMIALHDFRRIRSASQELRNRVKSDGSRKPYYGERLTLPQKQKHYGRQAMDERTRPQLVALPGGLQETRPRLPSTSSTPARGRATQRHTSTAVRLMQVAIAACLLLTLGVGSFIGLHVWQQQSAGVSGGITPPHYGAALPTLPTLRLPQLHDLRQQM